MAEDWGDIHQAALEETGYWGDAGSGCVIVSRDSGRFLLGRRSEEVLEPGTWGTWGGAIDPGQSPLESAIREAETEAGCRIHSADAALLYVYRDAKSGFEYHTFLIAVDHEFEPHLNYETDEADWFAFGDWRSPLHYGLEAILADPEALGRLRAIRPSADVSDNIKPRL